MTTEMSPTSMKCGNFWGQRSNSITTLTGGQMSGGEISSSSLYKSGFSTQSWSLYSFQKKIFWNTCVQISK